MGMTKMEIASYLGMTNIMLAYGDNDPNDDITPKIKQAILEAQLILTKAAIDELLFKGGED